MSHNILIFEGYDGAGKGTLIDAVRDYFSDKTIRVIGRKNEIQLQPISNLIEDETKKYSLDTELLLRIALEKERQKIISDAIRKYDIVILDRGFISLRSWVYHYHLEISNYINLFETLEKEIKKSTVIFCSADFETCWERINQKDSKSKKELLGKEENKRFHTEHKEVFDKYQNDNTTKIIVDTAHQSINKSLKVILEHLVKES